MNHTPEPWRASKVNQTIVADLRPEDAGAGGHADVDYYGGYLIAESIRKTADRDRIVACVNACKGIPNEFLDAGVVIGTLASVSAALDSPALKDYDSVHLQVFRQLFAEWKEAHDA